MDHHNRRDTGRTSRASCGSHAERRTTLIADRPPCDRATRSDSRRWKRNPTVAREPARAPQAAVTDRPRRRDAPRGGGPARSAVADHVVIVTAASQATRRASRARVELIVEPTGATRRPARLAAARSCAATPMPCWRAAADQHITDEAGLAKAFDLGLSAVETDDVIGTLASRRPARRRVSGISRSRPRRRTPSCGAAVRREANHATQRATSRAQVPVNAGIFFASARRSSRSSRRTCPRSPRGARHRGRHRQRRGVYGELQAISIDHAVMERATRVVTIPPRSAGRCRLVGCPARVARRGCRQHDRGRGRDRRRHRNIVMTDGPLVATVGSPIS